MHRHLSCSNGGSWHQRFDVVSYPGHLVFSGDMGSFIFRRETDMFAWFHSATIEWLSADYVGQKVQAGQGKEFSPGVFREVVNTIRDDWAECGYDDQYPEEFAEAFDEDGYAHITFKEETHEFLRGLSVGPHEKTEWYEYDLDGYTFQFIWALRAMRWAISTYYEMREPLGVAE